MSNDPTDTVKGVVDDAADLALGVAGGILVVAVAARGVEMIVGAATDGESEEGEE
jgi:hypothetical protein